MAGFLSFSAPLLKRLTREHWGYKITQQDGTIKDSGVQEFAEELLAALASDEPIKLNSTVKLIGPDDGSPAIQIINIGDGDGDPPPPLDFTGFTGSVQLLSDVDIDQAEGTVTIDGCNVSIDITVTLAKTFKTLTFESGLCKTVS